MCAPDRSYWALAGLALLCVLVVSVSHWNKPIFSPVPKAAKSGYAVDVQFVRVAYPPEDIKLQCTVFYSLSFPFVQGRGDSVEQAIHRCSGHQFATDLLANLPFVEPLQRKSGLDINLTNNLF